MPFRQLKESVARLFRKGACNLIPRIERLLHGEVRFDGLLDLVNAKLNSRDGLHGPPLRESVARGGNIAPDAEQFLCQERDKQFPIKPSAGTALVMFGNVPEVGKSFQSLKHQLNLPTHTVRSQNVRR